MLIPISTDAPIYYFPYATIGMIVTNVIFFFAFCLENSRPDITMIDRNGNVFENEDQLDKKLEELQESGELATEEQLNRYINSLRVDFRGNSMKHHLSVQFGRIRPWQWLTGNFMHADFMHLLGNMIFLWSFGLIVEGKIGWLRFTGVYLAICVLYGFVLQAGSLLFSSSSFALGASAAIFALLAICVIWAPANEFTVILLMFIGRFITFELNVLIFGFFFIAKEVASFILGGFRMSSELLHILGFAAGLPFGIWMVKGGFVDCEGWDFFSYMSGKTGRDSEIQTRAEKKQRAQNVAEFKKTAEKQKEIQGKVSAGLVQHFRDAIQSEDWDLALRLLSKLGDSSMALAPLEEDITRVVQALLHAKRYGDAMQLLEKHIDVFTDRRFALEVTLLKLWLRDKRPRKALQHMQGMNPAFLSQEQKQQLVSLANIAKKQITDGVVDLV